METAPADSQPHCRLEWSLFIGRKSTEGKKIIGREKAPKEKDTDNLIRSKLIEKCRYSFKCRQKFLFQLLKKKFCNIFK